MNRIVRFAATIVVGLASVVGPLLVTPPQPVEAAPASQLPGTTVLESVDVNGVNRDALVYVPSTRQAGVPAPLIVFMHGAGQDMLLAVRQFGLREEAERTGVIVAFPNGSTPNGPCCAFNVGAPIWGDKQSPDDVAFIGKPIDELTIKYTIDSNKVFASGMSNGGSMSYRLACEMSDRIAAVAVSGSSRDSSACTMSHPISVLAIHGTADPLARYEGGVNPNNGVRTPPESEVIGFWKTFDGCPADPQASMLTPVAEKRSYGPCKNGTEVQLITVLDGMHCWPGTELTYIPQTFCLPGGPHMSFKATPLVVDFLLGHPRQAAS